MDTAPTVAALPSDPQSNDATSNVEEILALLEAISLSPGDVQRLTTAIHNQIDSLASSPTPTTPPLPAPDIADEPAAAPVQVQEAADPNPVLLEPLAAIPQAAHPVAPAIPAEHFTTSRRGVLFLLPLQNAPGPYYLITKGRSIGVVADWSCASPLVTGVKGAVFHKVLSIGLGLQSMLSAIDNGTVEYL